MVDLLYRKIRQPSLFSYRLGIFEGLFGKGSVDFVYQFTEFHPRGLFQPISGNILRINSYCYCFHLFVICFSLVRWNLAWIIILPLWVARIMPFCHRQARFHNLIVYLKLINSVDNLYFFNPKRYYPNADP
ncbi:MAG: hypothetical protein B7Z16_14585, partial [Algoriphagus sp. 32-45-6]